MTGPARQCYSGGRLYEIGRYAWIKSCSKGILLLITYTVVLVMVLSRLGLIASGVAWVLGLVKPLLIGFALAFVLNRPCHFFFRLYDRGLSRTRARGRPAPWRWSPPIWC